MNAADASPLTAPPEYAVRQLGGAWQPPRRAFRRRSSFWQRRFCEKLLTVPYLVTDAGLVARSVKELLLEDCNFERSTVLTLHYASGCIIDCEKVNINNVAYKDCYIITFPTITLPSSSSGLVWRNLSEFTQKNLSFDNVILNASDVGYITADSQSVYYKYDVFSESDKINKTDKTQ